jgi:hypothetical protein
LRVYGALALDYPVGGLNPQAVDVALRIGTSVIWMPTFDARNWRVEQGGRHFNEREPISVLSDGDLVPACREILDLIGEHDATLASGHLGVDESVALLRDARQRGIRSVVTHASFWMPVEAQRELAALGCYVEQSAVAVMGAERAALFDGIAQQVRDVGSEHVVLSSDLGQLSNPAPVLGLAMWAEQFLSAGFDEASVGRMLRDNPRALLG